jgi:hypothetical protein
LSKANEKAATESNTAATATAAAEVAPATKQRLVSNAVDTSSPSPFSYFYSFIPKQILGVPVSEIKKDLSESTSQIANM